MGRIVVGVDGSESSRHALEWAARQARLTGDSLEVVTTWEIPPLMVTPSAAAVPEPQIDIDFAGEARTHMEQAVREVLGEHPDVDVKTLLLEGHPAPALLEAAEGAELIVVGSRGHGEFAGMLLGSVSMYLATHATCPVLIARSAR